MTNRNALITHIERLEDDITDMYAEVEANFKENERTLRYIRFAMTAIEYVESELRMMDLITFCQTGSYPND